MSACLVALPPSDGDPASYVDRSRDAIALALIGFVAVESPVGPRPSVVVTVGQASTIVPCTLKKRPEKPPSLHASAVHSRIAQSVDRRAEHVRWSSLCSSR